MYLVHITTRLLRRSERVPDVKQPRALPAAMFGPHVRNDHSICHAFAIDRPYAGVDSRITRNQKKQARNQNDEQIFSEGVHQTYSDLFVHK